MEIEGQVTRVEFSSLEPVIKTLFILGEDRLRFLILSDQFGLAAPECFRILNGFAVFFLVAHVFSFLIYIDATMSDSLKIA